MRDEVAPAGPWLKLGWLARACCLLHLTPCSPHAHPRPAINPKPPSFHCRHPYHHTAQTMKERGWMRYTAVEEAEITVERTAVVPEDIDRTRVRFQQVSWLLLGGWVGGWPACLPVRSEGRPLCLPACCSGRRQLLYPTRLCITHLLPAGRCVQPAGQPRSSGCRCCSCCCCCRSCCRSCCCRSCCRSCCCSCCWLPLPGPAAEPPLNISFTTPPPAVLAANLLCRLPDPMLFLARLPSLIKPGGVGSWGRSAHRACVSRRLAFWYAAEAGTSPFLSVSESFLL